MCPVLWDVLLAEDIMSRAFVTRAARTAPLACPVCDHHTPTPHPPGPATDGVHNCLAVCGSNSVRRRARRLSIVGP